jgi:nucleotide-binding universal stress UspA family protein
MSLLGNRGDTMKNVLLLVHDDAGQEARLQAALDLTRALEGHLICLDGMRYPITAGAFDPMAEAALLEQEREREMAHSGRIADRLGEEDVSWSMAARVGDLAECLIASAGLADLIVVNRQLDGVGPDMLATAGTVAIKSGKPVIAVPDTCRSFDVGGHAIVAWDGSPAAMAALTGTIPLLALASSVSIVEIQGEHANGSVEEAAAYLSRHDIHGDIDLVARSKVLGASVGETLQILSANQQAAYCVMGAYGHSPLREALFGGVTRHMLRASKIPLVLVH